MTLSPANSHGGISTVVVTLTDAQVKALPTTAVQILAAPGVGLLTVPLHVTLRLTWVADYTNIAATALLLVENGTNASTCNLDESVGGSVSLLLASGEASTAWLPAQATAPAAAGNFVLGEAGMLDGDVWNKAVSVRATNAASGDFTGGNAGNALKITLAYYTVTA